MMRFLLTACVLILASDVQAQRPRPRGSASDQAKIDKQRDDIAAMRQAPGELNVAGLKVGASGRPDWIRAKVIQVLGKDQMLVGLADSRTADRYDTYVIVKGSTEGVVDGNFWYGSDDWKKRTGSGTIKVTGTKTLRLAGGGTSTVFVIEAGNPTPAKKDAPKKPGRLHDLRNEAIAAGKAVESLMGEADLSVADRERIREYVLRDQSRKLVDASSEAAKRIINGDAVKVWIAAERTYIAMRDRK